MRIFRVETIGALLIFLLIIAAPVCAQRTPGTSTQAAPTASAQRAPDDCSWEAGSGAPRPAAGGGATPRPGGPGARKALKLRTAAEGKSYTDYNQGKPITLDRWFKFTCGLDPLVPQEIPADQPIAGAETTRVTLRGYLLAARFMRDGDHDMHVELAASPDWNTEHVVVELSPGTEYCAARKALWDLVRKDGCQEDLCIMKKPVEISVTGYVLIGNPPQGVTDYCHAIMSRGLHKGDQESHVRGLWRLQPVLSVKKR